MYLYPQHWKEGVGGVCLSVVLWGMLCLSRWVPSQHKRLSTRECSLEGGSPTVVLWQHKRLSASKCCLVGGSRALVLSQHKETTICFAAD